MPSFYTSISASTSTESLSLPPLQPLQRIPSTSYLHAKLQSLTRHYLPRTSSCTRPRSLSQPSHSMPCPSITTGGSVHDEEWVVVDFDEVEESDEDFTKRMCRERQQERDREENMLELQMMLWRRWGRPRCEEY